MGRVTIFSNEGCGFCRQSKAAFNSRNIPFVEIDISHYPQKRVDMLSLTDRLTVPQVFFNEEHIGGAEETLELLKRWDKEISEEGAVETPYDRYVKLVGSKPDPLDERFAAPSTPPATEYLNPSVTQPDIIDMNGNQYTTLELTKELIRKMPRGNVKRYGVIYHNCFTGSLAVTALQEIFQLQSTDEAFQLGLKLQHEHFITQVSKGEYSFGVNNFLFRLQPLHTPHVLNSFCVWKHELKNNPLHSVSLLAKQWDTLESHHLNREGLVDHATIRNDDLYWEFEQDVCKLQYISLENMDAQTKTAFVINLYNLMIKYASVKLGVPTNQSRGSFFDHACVNIGGCILSFNDLEHGILRANSRAPYHIRRPFSLFDFRRNLSLDGEVDPRIHFALNCGAKSCPPVKKYTVEALDEELRLAAMSFCEQDNNVHVDEIKDVVILSKIFYWYMTDFAPSKGNLPQKIMSYLRGEKSETLKKIITKGKFSVLFQDYDWSTTGCNSLVFLKSSLEIVPPETYPLLID